MIRGYRNGLLRWGAAVLLGAICALGAPRPAQKNQHELAEILARMDERARDLKTVTANLEYTKVTVLVNDHSTETGRIYFRKGRSPEVLLHIEKPDTKIILFKKSSAQIYTPKTNQLQEYDLRHHSSLLQQFLLLGFGSESSQMEKAYRISLLREERLRGDAVALLELVPRSDKVAAQLSKVQLWVSEDSWLPMQQQFFEPGGDYMLAKYTAMRVNRPLRSSTFRINTPKNVKRLKMD